MAKSEKQVKVKRKFLRRAKRIPAKELDANDIQIVVVSSLLEELEDGNLYLPLIYFIKYFKIPDIYLRG